MSARIFPDSLFGAGSCRAGAGGSEARDAILAAARAEFDDHGYTGTTLRAVARRGVPHGAVVHRRAGRCREVQKEAVRA